MKLKLILFALALSGFLFAAEEKLDLDSETVTKHPPSSASNGLKIMGRVDFSYEISPFTSFRKAHNNDTYKSNHYLLFLKASPTSNVSFMGEFLSKSFYEINYKLNESITLHAGKLIVPFGDTTYYHHFYGGEQGVNGNGIMFPNIWAEHGIHAELEWNDFIFDLYSVNGISSINSQTPDFNSASNGKRQAVGFRSTANVIPKLKFILSSYYTEWDSSKPLYLAGGDFVTDYRLIDTPVLRNLKLSAGVAFSDIEKSNSGRFYKYGDFVQLATNALDFIEPRVRYGSYIDNSKTKSAKDSHSLSVGTSIPIDALKVLMEYQWNFEAKDETENDLFRVMVALDF